MAFALASMIVAVSPIAAETAPYRVATFETDVTVPLGHALMGGGIAPASDVVDRLFARGVVLLGPEPPILWVAVDWCEIRNGAYDAWRDALASAAGTTRERVLLAAVHQHDTPVADFGAQELLDGVGLTNSLCDPGFVRECIAKSAEALGNAVKSARHVTHYGVGVAEVRGVASNRRVVSEDGTVRYARNSSAPDAAIREAPEGLVDPNVRTLSFWDGDTPVAGMSAYAVHPMSYYGRGGVSADFVGMARARMQAELGGTPYLYFSGCSGDVVAGKYNDGSEPEREKLAGRLFDGMEAAWRATERRLLERVTFRAAPLDLPIRESSGFAETDQRAILNDAAAKTFDRNLAAMGLSWRAARVAGRTIDLCAVDFGAAMFVVMPAESFVEYQLTVQRIRPDRTVLVAGYGESAPGYIPSEAAVAENFIAEHSWCWVGLDAPAAMNAALERLLAQ